MQILFSMKKTNHPGSLEIENSPLLEAEIWNRADAKIAPKAQLIELLSLLEAPPTPWSGREEFVECA